MATIPLGQDQSLIEIRRAFSAMLFMDGAIYALDAFGGVNSSPWTAESFGGDQQKADSCREYVFHAIGQGIGFSVIAAMIGDTLWPIIGMALECGYMFWLYQRALRRAKERGSTSWEG